MEELEVVIGENADTLTFKKDGKEIIVTDQEFVTLMELFLLVKEKVAEN